MEAPDDRQAVDLGDAASVRAFYDAALPRVYSYLFHRCGGQHAVAEDLTQETFMAAVKELKSHRQIESPVAWMLGIARHKLLDHIRAKAREQRRLEAVAAEAESDQLVEWSEDDEYRERAMSVLADVAEPQRSALILRYLDEMSVPEVAHTLGKSVHATESLIARGKRSFRRAYEEAVGA